MAHDGRDLPARIRALREALRMTQAELAAEVDVTAQHVSRLEIGQAAPSLDLLVRLSRRLGVSADFLLTGERMTLTRLRGHLILGSSLEEGGPGGSSREVSARVSA